jgi:hypothetical protein
LNEADVNSSNKAIVSIIIQFNKYNQDGNHNRKAWPFRSGVVLLAGNPFK